MHAETCLEARNVPLASALPFVLCRGQFCGRAHATPFATLLLATITPGRYMLMQQPILLLQEVLLLQVLLFQTLLLQVLLPLLKLLLLQLLILLLQVVLVQALLLLFLRTRSSVPLSPPSVSPPALAPIISTRHPTFAAVYKGVLIRLLLHLSSCFRSWFGRDFGSA